MSIERLLQILDDWALYMKSDNHKLGYPSKSLGMSSGGESTEDEFESMLSAMDLADRKSTRLNSSHSQQSRMPSSA